MSDQPQTTPDAASYPSTAATAATLASALVGAFLALGVAASAGADDLPIAVESPDGRNAIVLDEVADGAGLRFSVSRDGVALFGPSPLGPVLAAGGPICDAARVDSVERRSIDEAFDLPWGKTRRVVHRCSTAKVAAATGVIRWELELRAYDDGVAFRYRLLAQDGRTDFEVADEATRFAPVGEATALFNALDSFTTSHESVYERAPVADIPAAKLLDMPLVVTWPSGVAAAITEGRVRQFAGMYLERAPGAEAALRCRLSPLPGREGVCVAGQAPLESPWRVVLLADAAGKLLESNLLVCLNDPPRSDFDWVRPGKTTFHWWYGEFEDDHQLADERRAYVAKHRAYIDFCAKNGISYHAVSGDGLAWYKQSPSGYGKPAADADVRVARPELGLPEILAYARERSVGIRLWVHWKPLSEHLEDALAQYEAWGVTGLMVDFLDRDDQEMIEFTERMLESAARHKLDIQIHGSSKSSGEQRTWPNLFNREGVLNLEYLKWSDLCTPAHNVNVAYTRALAGPVDYHLGGFRSVSRAEFAPSDRAPVVMGTRCHNLALYVVFENPMPMVADAPSEYAGQAGFDFLAEVPTTWDETRFLAGEIGEYVVVARRKGASWYLGGITNWTPRELEIPLDALGDGRVEAQLWVDGSLDESQPNAVRTRREAVAASQPLCVSLAPGGGFVGVLHKE